MKSLSYCFLRRITGRLFGLWDLAFSFDIKARRALSALIENGYAHAVLAGNALTLMSRRRICVSYWDSFRTEYLHAGETLPNGHYNHLDLINRVRAAGSMKAFVEQEAYRQWRNDGNIKNDVPIVPRRFNPYWIFLQRYTEVLRCTRMLWELHVSKNYYCNYNGYNASFNRCGNMTPSFRVLEDGTIRQTYFYVCDASEFVVNKLADRGSLSSKGIITNAQDFICNIADGLGLKVLIALHKSIISNSIKVHNNV